MLKANVNAPHQNLLARLGEMQERKHIEIRSHAMVIARIVAESDTHDHARARLLTARKRCRIGDVPRPTGVAWNANRDRSWHACAELLRGRPGAS